MRIKKKHVLLESNLIDMTSEFTPQEKRLLFVLNKQYGPADYKTFSIWDAAAFLIELFEIPYDLAYDLSETYYYNGDKLFKEYEPIRKKLNTGEVFFRHISDMFDIVKEGINDQENDNIGTINIKYKGDDYGPYTIDREVKMWTHSYGFTLYIPFHYTDIGEWPNSHRISIEERDDRLLMVSVRFSELEQETPPEDKWEKNINENEFRVNVTIEIGDRTDRKKSVKDFMNFKVPIPKPLSKNNMSNTVKLVLDDIMEKLRTTEFDLIDSATPIDIPSELDSND